MTAVSKNRSTKGNPTEQNALEQTMRLTDDNEEKVDEVLGRTDQTCVTVCAQVQKDLNGLNGKLLRAICQCQENVLIDARVRSIRNLHICPVHCCFRVVAHRVDRKEIAQISEQETTGRTVST